jgi:ubiquitin thioesterase protein OTUB1
MITSAWMKSHADYYAGFLESGDVNAYCQRNIDPFAVELEHFGLQALATALINEAGIAIEVLYLDRSTGTEVTPHKFSVLDAACNEVESASTIRLLYRPYVSEMCLSYKLRTNESQRSLRPIVQGRRHCPNVRSCFS